MNRYPVLFFTLYLSISSAISFAQEVNTNTSFLNILKMIAESDRVVFTLETAFESNEAVQSFQFQMFDQSLVKNNLNLDCLDRLNAKTDKPFVLVRSLVAENVYHVIDSRLIDSGINPLETKLPMISFKGSTYDLFEEISRRIPKLELQSVFGSGSPPPFAYWKEATVQAENVSLRDLFTKAVDTSDKKAPILWISQTSLSDGKTYFYYY